MSEMRGTLMARHATRVMRVDTIQREMVKVEYAVRVAARLRSGPGSFASGCPTHPDPCPHAHHKLQHRQPSTARAEAHHLFLQVAALVGYPILSPLRKPPPPLPRTPSPASFRLDHTIPNVPYYLEEEKSCGLSTAELAKSLEKANAEGIDCIINPGNPTGQTLSWNNMNEVKKKFHLSGTLCGMGS
ncbi:hypothetical protein BC830DRAFT_1077084 [Chytriomyces sp. MP71]|nr:hypothetical protein BC830DRAFT_1077084 [Chytriomyces sp. MP71]